MWKLFIPSENYRELAQVVAFVTIGLVLYAFKQNMAAGVVLGVGSVVSVIPLIVDMVKEIKAGNFGVDILAVTAILASLALGEVLVAGVILLMLTGGEALESYAQEHAKKELGDLLSRAPKTAHLWRGQQTKDIPVDAVKVGDRLLVKPGETVPVDARVVEGTSSFDEAAITGESLPVGKTIGQDLVSGSINTTRAVTVEATRTSGDSQYQQIVKLVQSAASSRSPLIRLADQYSVPFTLLSLLIAGIAWAMSGQALRALEVLVVATPCPLLLATPVAIVSGMSRAARYGIIVKSGAALEKLAVIRTIAFDKTGTLTEGTPKVATVHAVKLTEDELVAIVAAVEHSSAHILARAMVVEAKDRRLKLPRATNMTEEPGSGVMGEVAGRSVVAGKASWLEHHGVSVPATDVGGQTVTLVSIDGHYAGVVTFADRVRPETVATLKQLTELGISKILMLTGDQAGVAKRIASEINLKDTYTDLRPVDKVDIIKRLDPSAHPVAMVGDGVNDAPTLVSADVGIALGARGSTAASESADVVIMPDDLGHVPMAIQVARRALRIAKESIWTGIALSVVLMLIATSGIIKPVYGALLQEVVDVVVILNALRARTGPLLMPSKH